MLRVLKYSGIVLVIIALRVGLGLVTADARSDRTRPDTHIIINSIMKCGSTYVTAALQENLGYTRFRIPKSQDYKSLDLKPFFQSDARILKLHVFPEVIDWNEYYLYSDKIVIQLRDPRQAILSWVYHMRLYYEPDDNFVPEYFHAYSLSQQIDWAIDHRLSQMVKFINSWVAFSQQQEKSAHGIKVLFTTYDQLLTDEAGLFRDIVDFYQFKADNFSYRAVPKDKNVLYRKGDPNEWRTVFTAEQKRNVAQLIPSDLLNRFNWQP